MERANLALGTMYFDTRVDEQTSFDLLDRFVEAGGRVIDTANAYSFWTDPSGLGGQSEALIGRWLARRPGLRDHLVISTKVGAAPTVAGEWPSSAEGLSAPAIKAAGERSRAGPKAPAGGARRPSCRPGPGRHRRSPGLLHPPRVAGGPRPPDRLGQRLG